MPTDAPLLRVLAKLEEEGFVGQFVPREGGVLRCAAGNHEFSAASADAESARRLEGVSDPADMMIVFGLRCPICGAAGTLVLHYGPESSPEESDVLAAFETNGGDRGEDREP
jgi:hypothetical protein